MNHERYRLLASAAKTSSTTVDGWLRKFNKRDKSLGRHPYLIVAVAKETLQVWAKSSSD
jgi:hypothetical protein